MDSICYKFEGFKFRYGRLINLEMNEITLAPKESAVLRLLLERANEIVTKEDFVQLVWKGGIVSDESLTRCIYVLRRILGHSDSRRFIETVYGKGYRFVADVQTVDDDFSYDDTPAPVLPPGASGNPSIALFPFEMENNKLSISLHDMLVERLQRIIMDSSASMHVISSFVTRAYRDYSDFLLAIEKSNADYYITGAEVYSDDNCIIRLELVRAYDHSVLGREGVTLTGDHHLNFHAIFKMITILLSGIGVAIKDVNITTPAPEIGSEIIAEEKHQHYSTHTLRKHLDLICEERGHRKRYANNFHEAIAIYFSIANHGIIKYPYLRDEINHIFKKMAAKEPNKAIALALQAVLEEGDTAAEKFKLGLLLYPGIAEVYYYYACFLATNGDYYNALRMNNISIDLNKNSSAAKILSLIIYYLMGDYSKVFEIGDRLLLTRSCFTSIVKGILALIYVSRGELKKAWHFTHAFEKIKSECDFIAYCYDEVHSRVNGDHTRHFPNAVERKPQESKYVAWNL
ncbi:winged helix-turn-helix domain-containing protein [Pseudescherichia vulneris]